MINYDSILGRYILHELGVNFNFKKITIAWQEVFISMKPKNSMTREFFVIKENRRVQNTTKNLNLF